MTRITLLAAGLAAALLLASPIGGAGGMATAPIKLKGVTGPGFTITLKRGTVRVRTLKPGRYTITVQDKSELHNFRLKGPMLNKQITGLAFEGTKSVTVTLRRGKHTFQCDPHVLQGMKGTFTVR